MKNRWKEWLGIGCILVALLATNRWMNFDEGTRWVQAFDSFKYLRLTQNFPDFPVGQDVVKSHLAQRVMIHYTAASLSHSAGIDLGVAYQILVGVLTLAVTFLLWKLIQGFGLPFWNQMVLYALFFLNPYTLRYYFLAPGLLADLVYIAGLLCLLLGVQKKQIFWVCAGALLGQLGRQNMLILMPAILFWWVFDFQPKEKIRKWVGTAVCMALVVGAHVGTLKLTAAFSESTQHTLSIFWSLFTWMAAPEFSFSLLLDHFFRVLLPLSFLGTAMVFSGVPFKEWFKRETWFYWLLIAATQAPNVLVDPIQQQRSQTRYTGFAMVPMILIFVIVMLERLKVDRSPKASLALLGLLLVGSFHHLYSVVSWGGSPVVFSIIHVVVALIFGWIFRLSRPSHGAQLSPQ